MTPRIYVACLSSYVEGKLYGTWIDCNQDTEAIEEEIQKMLKSSPALIAEEYAIHASENFGEWQISEYESIAQVSRVAQWIQEYGESITHYIEAGYDTENIESFEDDYCGKYATEEEFVEEYLDEMGIIQAVEKAGLQAYYIDFERVARDWFIDSFWSSKCSEGGIHVFRRS